MEPDLRLSDWKVEPLKSLTSVLLDLGCLFVCDQQKG